MCYGCAKKICFIEKGCLFCKMRHKSEIDLIIKNFKIVYVSKQLTDNILLYRQPDCDPDYRNSRTLSFKMRHQQFR